ncbi:hypothetical protein DMENIID0001_039780 [Sergentomyia squamirostris]
MSIKQTSVFFGSATEVGGHPIDLHLPYHIVTAHPRVAGNKSEWNSQRDAPHRSLVFTLNASSVCWNKQLLKRDFSQTVENHETGCFNFRSQTFPYSSHMRYQARVQCALVLVNSGNTVYSV